MVPTAHPHPEILKVPPPPRGGHQLGKKKVFHFFFLSQIQENMRECQNGRRQTKSISEQDGGEERREFRMPCNSIFDRL